MARFYTPAGSGGSGEPANIADFIFTNEDEDVSSITLPINKEMTIETTRDDDSDADINIRSADDVFIRAYGDEIGLSAFGAVEISTNDDNYYWSFNTSGCIRLPGNGEICNPINSSGDGLGLSTISINPDTGTESNQYIIIDPTAPNHIHIRAGGNIDESGADLFLGGEKNNVVVSDSARDVFINTRPDMVINSYTNLNEVPGINFIVDSGADIDLGYTVNVDGTEYLVDSVTPYGETIIVTATGASFTAGQSYTFFYNPEYTNSWQFDSNGTLHGPVEGLLKVDGIYGQNEFPLAIIGPESVLLDGDAGEFLNDASVPSNQIATIGDIANTVSDVTSYNPTWSGTDLAFTGTPAVGSYVKIGSVVTVQIDVEFDNVTNFGTGQYSVTLPFASRYHTDVYGGSVHSVNGTTDHYSLKGHLSPSSSTMTIWSLKSSAQDEPFDHNSPVVLTTADKFHMSFTYICE